MKHNKVNIVCLILVIGMVSIIAGGCKNSSDVQQDIVSPEIINAFENLTVEFTGWNGKGTISINNDLCSETVKEKVEFKYETSLNGSLKNDDIITIYANVLDDTVKLEYTSFEYLVSGLPRINKVEPFQNGVAWFTYTDSTEYLACMNSNGKVLFQYKNVLSDYTNFVNDRAMIVFGDRSTVGFIDTTGKIIKTVSNGEIVFICDDYCVGKETIKDFDNNYILYTIYNNEGDIVYKDKSAEEYDFVYLGNDVMVLDSYGNGFSGQKFGNLYFIDINKKIDDATITRGKDFSLNNLFAEGVILTDMEALDDILYFMDKEGNLIKRTTGHGVGSNGWTYGKFNDGVVVFYRYLGKNYEIGYYDYLKNEYVDGTEKLKPYLNKINFDKSPLYFSNGIVLFQMRGEDGKNYIMAFDKNWDVVLQPIEGNTGEYFENSFKIAVNDGCEYYSYSGNLLFKTTEYLKFREGIAYSKTFQWIGENGQVVFDNIDISDVNTIELCEKPIQNNIIDIIGEYVGNYNTYIKIIDETTIQFIENEVVYETEYKMSNKNWIATFTFENIECTVTLILDEMGNLLIVGEENKWIDEYFRKL